LRCGPFSIQDALSLSQIEDAFHDGSWKKLIRPVDSPLWNWMAIIVGRENQLDIRNGRPFTPAEAVLLSEEYCRAYDLEGNFLAVLRYIPEARQWHPEKVFSVSEDNNRESQRP
jgi:tRNA U55 pseudouridine synthase TruB